MSVDGTTVRPSFPKTRSADFVRHCSIRVFLSSVLRLFRLPVFSSCCVLWVCFANETTKIYDGVGPNCHHTYYFRPSCIDRPDRYSCQCGPGFTWNTKKCVADGLNSYFEFSRERPLRYSALVNKPFPTLTAFTVSFWVRVQGVDNRGTVMSYTDLQGTEVLHIGSGPSLHMKLHDDTVTTNVKLNASRWAHVTWTWSSQDGSWSLVVNGGQSVIRGTLPGTRTRPILPGGRLFLGQRAAAVRGQQQDPGSKDSCCPFLGDIGFVNIWRRTIRSADEVQAIYSDCTMMQCGDAIQWADFRSGTRGAMKIRWPSNIHDESKCYSDLDSTSTCDQYCSAVKGARCREEILDNIRWGRTPADDHVRISCPGSELNPSNSSRFVHRRCLRTAANEGVWSPPVIDYCVSAEEIRIKQQVDRLVNGSPMNEHQIGHVLRIMRNRTSGARYVNVLDVATVVNTLRTVIRTQLSTIQRFSEPSSIYKYGLSRRHDKGLYPTWRDTLNFAQLATEVVDHLLDERNEDAWEYSMPSGSEGDRLFQAVDELLHLLSVSLHFHLGRGDIVDPEAVSIQQTHNNIKYSIRLVRTAELDSVVFRDGKLEIGEVHLPLEQNFLAYLQPSSTPTTTSTTSTTKNYDYHSDPGDTEFDILAMGEFRASRTLNKITGKTNKDDCVNSPVISFKIYSPPLLPPLSHHPSSRSSNEANSFNSGAQRHQLVIRFPYLQSFNVSSPECVHLEHGNRTAQWSWSPSLCSLESATNDDVTCRCSSFGFFALLSDLYNVNWTPEEPELTFVTFPSYVGCSVSIFLCLLSFVLLFFFRATSKTASLHKNFALAIVGGKLVYIFGTEQIKNEMLCHVMAAMLHYFFLSAFCWLMNEAFNLYIVITYAAHSRGGEQSDGGSLLRFHVLGWVFPGVVVGAVIGVHSDDYFANEMCWLNWKYIWLMFGPAIGIISVTMLVLIFTAKEQAESAYSKNERTNRMIAIYTKSLWTQTILLSVVWMFVVLSVRMKGDIVKWLFALFDIMQGVFFFVFYFLLNDEVITAYKAAMKRRDLNNSDGETSPIESIHNLLTANEEAIEMVANPGVSSPGSGSNGTREHRPEQTSLLVVRKDDSHQTKNSNDHNNDEDDDYDDEAKDRRLALFATTEV